MDSNNKKYKYITVNDKAFDVMNHPAFKGFGFYLFPWNDKNRYSKDMTMKEVAPLHLWHTNINAQEEVDGVNRLIDDIKFFMIFTQKKKKRKILKNNLLDFFSLEEKKMHHI